MNNVFNGKADENDIYVFMTANFGNTMTHKKQELKMMVKNALMGDFNVLNYLDTFNDYFKEWISNERRKLIHIDTINNNITEMKSQYKIILALIRVWLIKIDANESAKALFGAINSLFHDSIKLDDITVHSLVTLSIEFQQRLNLIDYPSKGHNDKYYTPELKWSDNFFNFIEVGVDIWDFYSNKYADKFHDRICSTLSTNDKIIFDLAIQAIDIKKVKGVKEKFDTRIAPNIEILEHSDCVDLNSLLEIDSGYLRNINESKLLGKPVFNINETSLLKLLNHYENDPFVKFNQIKFYNTEYDKIYSRILMESYGDYYLIVFDESNDDEVCGIPLKESESMELLKLKFNDSNTYEYNYDMDIFESIKL